MSTTASELAGAALRAPFTRRARRELGFCLAGAVPAAAGFLLVVALLFTGTALTATLAGAFPGLLVLVLMLRLARRLGGLHRRLAGRMLGRPFAAPPPFVAARGLLRRLDARLRDGAGWRAVAYTALKLPLAMLELYAASFWVSGAINVACPLWWRVFSPSQIVTPLPAGSFGVHNTAGAFAAFLVGSATLLAAPWLTRAVTTADGWLIRGLLGPAQLAQRVAELEASRSLAVDDAAAALRKVERDLHDGAQVRLAALALGLGMAKEKLGDDGKPLDIGQAARVRELVDAAHRSAKDALVELRDLARGIHPPVLDAGLADALATLAAQSIIPVEVRVDLAARPTPAIETIAYFCAAELLANAAKHSGANRVIMELAQHGETFGMRITDDGIGGADPTRGSGLPGLVQRVRTVDGRLTLDSPPGGPTVVTVELPLRA